MNGGLRLIGKNYKIMASSNSPTSGLYYDSITTITSLSSYALYI